MATITLQQAFELAFQHHQAGRLTEAEQLYRRILASQPAHADALHLLGVVAHQVGRNEIAVDLIERALALRPNWPEAHSNRGEALRAQGRLDDAVAAYRRAVALNPIYVEALNNLGNALTRLGRLDEAIDACRQAIVVRPDYPEAHFNLGVALYDSGQFTEAVIAYQHAIACRSNYSQAFNNLGNALKGAGQGDEAIGAYRHAIALSPGLAEAHSNLGAALKDVGQLDESVAALRQAISLKPDYAEAHSNLLYIMHFHPGFDSATLAEEHRRWNRQHAEPIRQFVQALGNTPDPDRRLRIGYVSPDLCRHPVTCHVLPLLANHDHAHFEIFCYAQVPAPDEMTERLRAHADHWRSTVGRSDEQVAKQVRDDAIDILVDLAGHTANSRLLVFARKPAPIQVTRQGYPDTTGMTAIDFRMTDAFADPVGLTDPYTSETLIRLPRTNWIYQPPDEARSVPPAPNKVDGRIVFASFNHFAKLNEFTLKLWCRILRAAPQSQLLVKDQSLRCDSARQRLLRVVSEGDISPDRIIIVGQPVPTPEYFRLFHRAAIALDPFPYHGTATTCDTLWMGVPVITLAGQTHVSRVGVSLLTQVGLAELIAIDADDYVRITADLANDRPRLQAIRATLRTRMEQSPLMDAPQFARDVEDAYRQMWRSILGR